MEGEEGKKSEGKLLLEEGVWRDKEKERCLGPFNFLRVYIITCYNLRGRSLRTKSTKAK